VRGKQKTEVKVVVLPIREKAEATKPEKKSHLQLLISLLAVIIAAGGLVAPLVNVTIQRDIARSNRFTSAIEHLKDESLAIRMGALFELRTLGREEEKLQENILRILGPFVREGIENRDLLLPPKTDNGLPRPKEDVFLACEILAIFWNTHRYTNTTLDHLQAEKIDLSYIDLTATDLSYANFKGSNLMYANLQRSNLFNAQLQGVSFCGVNLYYANLRGANIQNASFIDVDLDTTNYMEYHLSLASARNLTAEQLMEAIIDDTVFLDDDLRAEYDRLKAEQPTTPAN